ncbi:MAG: cobalt-precorrin 5A hydrolase [Lachnospiraceae bacterium]|nr:cobalt-precorrin 5A hydrolase [Lachnospiraceae bacterium]
MRAAIIGFTRSGCGLAGRIREELRGKGWDCRAYGKCACAEECQVEEVSGPLKEWTRQQFDQCQALIFVGATGIAVRSIAPFVKSKLTDPAVLCMDEQARFVISLLSGHVGGANELALQVAAWLGAQPVITTATDLSGKFAVDVFAREQNLAFYQKDLAKEVSAVLLENKTVGWFSEFPVAGELPGGLLPWGEAKTASLGIAVSIRENCRPFARTLQLFPRIAVLGMGCRRGADPADIRSLAEQALAGSGISRRSIQAIASIDLKKQEPGLLSLAREWDVPFLTYSAEELSRAEYEGGLSESEFVKKTTGVGNVCERAALLAGGRVLVQRRMAERGVTAAIACGDFQVRFLQEPG